MKSCVLLFIDSKTGDGPCDAWRKSHQVSWVNGEQGKSSFWATISSSVKRRGWTR